MSSQLLLHRPHHHNSTIPQSFIFRTGISISCSNMASSSEQQDKKLVADKKESPPAPSITDLASQIQSQVDAQLQQIRKEKQELESEKAEWLKSADKLSKTQIKNRIKLDIGGTVFATSPATLKSIDNTYFSAMVSGRWELAVEEDGCIFIDRDPFVFRHILNFLREYPKHTLKVEQLSQIEKESLIKDAEFYHIEELLELLKPRFFSDSVLASAHYNQIISWLGFTPSHVQLQYRASRDGFQASVFHSKCDNVGPTITFIKSTNGNIFGGYTPNNWNQSGNYQNGSNDFLFTLVNQSGIQPTKFVNSNATYGIFGNTGYGPIWGAGHDLYIADNSNTNTNSSSNFPNSFQGTTGNNTFAGAYNFQTTEIEVYLVRR